ncbi:MAG: hypothetical protein LQ350_006245 [Teloschistes chrysophthalmus]|nr:MAG: hypothetical protein LQ350_006245 [Niorma chrysophthalma]
MTRARTEGSKRDPTACDIQSECPPHCTKLAKNPKPRLRKAPFPFLELPTELRVKIYHDALTYEYILVQKKAARRRGAAAFLITNRLIYSEAFPIFYDVNVFQVHIDGLPSSTEIMLANVQYMRQCCLEVELLPQPLNPRKVAKAKKECKDEDGNKGKKVKEIPRDTVIRKLLDKFLEEIWRGQIECLLIDLREHRGEKGSIALLEKFTWMSSVHLVQVVVSKIKPKGEVVQSRDFWCQRVELEMMRPRWCRNGYEKRNPSDGYIATPQLGINLVGEELEVARKEGGWVIGEDDLFVAFGKGWVPQAE